MKVLATTLLLLLSPMTFAKSLTCTAAVYDMAKNTQDYFNLIDKLEVEDLSESEVQFEPSPVAQRNLKLEIDPTGSLWSDAVSINTEDNQASYNFAVSVKNNLITHISIENEVRHTSSGVTNKTGSISLEASSSDLETYIDINCSVVE